MPETRIYFYQGEPVEVLSKKGKAWRVLQAGQEVKILSQELEPETDILHELWQNKQASSTWAQGFRQVSLGLSSVGEVTKDWDEAFGQGEPPLEPEDTSTPFLELPPPRPTKRHRQVGVTAQNISTSRDRFTRGPSSVTMSRGHSFHSVTPNTPRSSGRVRRPPVE